MGWFRSSFKNGSRLCRARFYCATSSRYPGAAVGASSSDRADLLAFQSGTAYEYSPTPGSATPSGLGGGTAGALELALDWLWAPKLAYGWMWAPELVLE
jgi:hypothetical protein